MQLPELETSRLILRVPVATDAVDMCRFVTDNRDHFAHWDPIQPPEYYTVDFWHHEISRIRRISQEGKALYFVLCSEDSTVGKIIGKCNFSNIVRGAFQAAHLGFGLDSRFTGNGLMTEALQTAIMYAFGPFNLHRIMANYMPDNTRSEKLLENLGFTREGFARNYLFLAGDWQDHVLTSLTNPDWMPQTCS